MNKIFRIKSYSLIIGIVFILALLFSLNYININNHKTFIFYCCFFVCSMVFMHFASISDSKVFFWLAIVITAFIMTFRAQTGYDDFVYKEIYLRAGECDFFTYVFRGEEEIGYLIVNYIFYHILSGNYVFFQSIITLLTFVLWGHAIQKYKSYGSPTMFLFILWTHYYFIVMSAALIRIFIALPLVLEAIYYLSQSNVHLFVGYIFIASLFHVSSAFILILLLLQMGKEFFFKYWMLLIIVLSIIIPIGFLIIAKVLVPILGAKYSGYDTIGNLKISLRDFDVLPICIIGKYYLKKAKDEDKKILVIAIVLCFMSIMFSIYNSLVNLGRLSFYGNLGIMIIASKKRYNGGKDMFGIILPIFFIIYGILYMMYTALLNPSDVDFLFPYISIWRLR